MKERMGLVKRNGQPLILLGTGLKTADKIPDCELTATDLQPVKLSCFRGKVMVISVVPSLDTAVCDKQTRKFNERVSALGEKVVLITVSMDLPFAQKRWCGAAGLPNAITLSDHRSGAFGESFGVLIKDIRLLARAVFVVDAHGKIAYEQIVPELTDEPDYESALQKAKQLIK